jgi:hypothetical protein
MVPVDASNIGSGTAFPEGDAGGGGGGGAAVTVNDAEPLIPSIVAWIDDVPAAFAVATPDDDSDATVVFDDAHVAVLPLSTLPFESFATACAWAVWPTAMLDESSVTTTEAVLAGGGTLTVSDAEPLMPSTVALIETEPAAFAVTRPVVDTVATDVFDAVHVALFPVSSMPLESIGIACACAVWPGARLDESKVTATVAVVGGGGCGGWAGGVGVEGGVGLDGGGLAGGFGGGFGFVGGAGSDGDADAAGMTRTNALSLRPSIVNTTHVEPRPFDRIKPEASTVATLSVREVQFTTAPERFVISWP